VSRTERQRLPSDPNHVKGRAGFDAIGKNRFDFRAWFYYALPFRTAPTWRLPGGVREHLAGFSSMKRLRTLTICLLGLLVALLALPGVAVAATSGQIKGLVIDTDGLAIPQALVTLESAKLIGGAQQRTSDDEGNFIFTELPPGSDYKVRCQKQGFGAVTKEGVDVRLGATTTVTCELSYGGETVVVEESAKTIDTESASRGSTLTKDFLSRIPSGRSYQAAVGQAAGVTGGGGGNPNSGGAAYNENTILLDGVNTTDPVTGTFSLNFNFDAIEEIQVITGGFDPEYGSSLGAVFSIVTKSGGNTLEVVANGIYRNENWGPKLDARFASDGYEIAPTGFDSSGESVQVGLAVSGPILKDRIWYFGAYEYNKGLYSNIGVTLPLDIDGHSFFGKLTAQPSSAHRFTWTVQSDPATFDNIAQYSTVYPEAQGRQAQGGYSSSLKWNWFINPEANLDSSLSYQKSFIEQSTVPCTHDKSTGYNPCSPGTPENYIDFYTPGRVGTYGAYDSVNYGYFDFDDRFRIAGETKLSILQVEALGKHDFKAGIEGNFLSWDRVVGYNGNLLYYDLYVNAFDPNTLENYYWVEVSGPYQYRSTGYHVGAFVQDVWKPIENLTFRYGIRYDRAVMRNDAGTPVVDVGIFGPRAYAVWDPFNNQKTKIYGGYGRFNDSGSLGVSYYLSQNGLGQKVFVGEYFGNFESGAESNAADYTTENTTSVWDNTTVPHSDEFSVGAQREIIPNLAAGVEFTGKFTRNIYVLDETNLIYDEDGYGLVGTGNGTTDVLFRLRTPAIALRDYYQTDISLERAWSERWLLLATYSYVVSRGRVQNSLTSAALANPAQIDLYYGNLGTDIRHQVKLAAAWDIPNDPWTTTIGASGNYFSGVPYSRYYYSPAGGLTTSSYSLLKERLGTYTRSIPYWQLSLLLEQDIPVKKGKLAGTLQIDNVTNNRYPTSTSSGYISTENRYIVFYRQDPIAFRVGAKYEF